MYEYCLLFMHITVKTTLFVMLHLLFILHRHGFHLRDLPLAVPLEFPVLLVSGVIFARAYGVLALARHYNLDRFLWE